MAKVIHFELWPGYQQNEIAFLSVMRIKPGKRNKIQYWSTMTKSMITNMANTLPRREDKFAE